jgi:hypothetical protein
MNVGDISITIITVGEQHYPLVICYIAIENGHFSLIYPLKMVIFHSYVSLPECNIHLLNMYPYISNYCWRSLPKNVSTFPQQDFFRTEHVYIGSLCRTGNSKGKALSSSAKQPLLGNPAPRSTSLALTTGSQARKNYSGNHTENTSTRPGKHTKNYGKIHHL